MKTKLLFTIAALLGLSLVPALPSHAQRSNPCKEAPDVKPSRETRQIRVEKYGIAFNIPENYRTRSDIKENNMRINVYNPTSLALLECLITNKIPGPDDFWSSTIYIRQRQASMSLNDMPETFISSTKIISNRSNLTIANQPAISFDSGVNSARIGYYREALHFLFLLPSKEYSVLISYSFPNQLASQELLKEFLDTQTFVGNMIKSSFTFDLNSSADSFTSSKPNTPQSSGISNNQTTFSQASNNPATKLLNGVYVGEGTMFNNSHREVLSRNNRLCIKFVDGPASPYSGRQEITISSLSLRSGKLFTDSYTSYANGTELEAFAGEDLNPPYSTFLYKDVKAAFRHAERTYWVYRGKTLRNINPEMDKDLQECVTSQGVYKKTRKGAVIDGIKPSW